MVTNMLEETRSTIEPSTESIPCRNLKKLLLVFKGVLEGKVSVRPPDLARWDHEARRHNRAVGNRLIDRPSKFDDRIVDRLEVRHG